MVPPARTQSLIPHNEALNHYLFSGEIKLLQGLHIGSGRGDETTDALVIRDAQGKPIIPGSSLRGVFRSHMERILMGLYATQVTPLWACQLYEPVLPEEKVCVGSSAHPASLAEIRSLQKLQEGQSGTDAVWKKLPEVLCDACKLFGAGSFYASKVRFTDLPMLTGSPNPVVRHGVGIHRDTGTAADGVKYDKEVVEAGATFRFEATAENLVDADLELLALGFSQLVSGELALGGSSGRGLGGVELIHGKAAWVTLKEKSEAVTYLLKKTYPHQQELSAFIDSGLKKLLAPAQEGGANAQANP